MKGEVEGGEGRDGRQCACGDGDRGRGGEGGRGDQCGGEVECGR